MPFKRNLLKYNDPNLIIPSATPSETDAAQYVVIKGKTQYNLCGQFSVCWSSKEKTLIHNTDEFLLVLKEKDPALVSSLFPNGVARTTGTYDLECMLALFGYPTPCMKFSEVKIDPPTIRETLKEYRLIVGVHIDSGGYFVGAGTPHWVVLDELRIADSRHAICDFYNPYSNLIEPYSWREFMTTTGSYKNGIWVQREYPGTV